MLNRDASGAQDRLKLGNVQPQDGHGQRKQNGREQVPVLGCLIEQGRVLEDAEAAGAGGHEVEPLHDYKVDEVNGRRLIDLLRVVVEIDIRWGPVAEPELVEGDSVALEVPERHGERESGLYYTNNTVGLEDKLPVDEAVLLGVAGWAGEDVSLGLLV